MNPLVIKQFDPVLAEAIDCEQKKAGDITYTSVKFGKEEGGGGGGGEFLQLGLMENLSCLISKVIILCP